MSFQQKGFNGYVLPSNSQVIEEQPFDVCYQQDMAQQKRGYRRSKRLNSHASTFLKRNLTLEIEQINQDNEEMRRMKENHEKI
mmetsp:Transcript_26897/g.25957  ORF Transcript_26897/g.25957 Transcript_26897/m.25957 type:complete len:83 (+) Transcript_26897:208-456(+)